MSTQLRQSSPRKPGSVIEVLEAKSRPAKTRPVRYDYWLETHRPLVCLAFVLPLLIWYEASMIVNPDSVRSGLDRFVQLFIPGGPAGFGLLSVVSVGIFLFLHYQQKRPGQLQPKTGPLQLKTFCWMAIESVALGTILFLASDALMLYFDNQRPTPLAGLVLIFSDPQQYGRFLTCLGTGIHEEVVFRLLLFAPLFRWLRRGIGQETISLIVSASLVSLLFATAHCDVFNPEGYPFQESTFLFRFLASVFLCLTFRFRGIAVAIGVHAFFDVLAIS